MVSVKLLSRTLTVQGKIQPMTKLNEWQVGGSQEYLSLQEYNGSKSPLKNCAP